MERLSALFLTLAIILTSCAAPKPLPSPLLKTVREIHPDGSIITLPEPQLTVFQRYVRTRIPAPPAPQLTRLFLLEVDLPAGTGREGAYLVVALFGNDGEFEYFEQSEHLPRRDRYFHRRMTRAELAEFLAFVQSHPIETLPLKTPPAATQPANENAGGLAFRYTDAKPAEARTVTFDAPTSDDHPAIDLIHQFSTLRDATTGGTIDSPETPALLCTSIANIPVNSQILFADPERRVLNLSFKAGAIPADDDLRAEIYPPLDFSFAQWTEESPVPQAQWYMLRNKAWIKSDPPPPPSAAENPATTTPTTLPAPGTLPASQPATAPDPFSDPGLLPTAESWHTEAGDGFTTVWHYVPFDPHHGQWLGFVVPILVFDDAHMRVDIRRNVIDLIHDGQLIQLPIPAAALTIR